MKQDYIYKVQSVVDTLYDVIGLFEEANYYQTGWYRPSMKCIMQGSGTSCTFCKICLEYLTFNFLSYPHSVIRKKDDYEWKFPMPGTKKYDYTSLVIDSLYPSPFNDELSGGSIHISTIQIDKIIL
ncbi:MAG TPA: M64 family metallopeptidase [Chitinispirillaceae bacterium]|nr:M64 family metallopeptidase [Chitinispirillaceae bacterium]